MGKLSEDIASLSNQITPSASDPVAQHMQVMYQVLSRLAQSVENIEEKCATKEDLHKALAVTNENVAENKSRIDDLTQRVDKLEKEREDILFGVNTEIDARIRKQRNLVIFGMPESNRATAGGRKEQDLTITKDLFKDMKLDPDEAVNSIRTLYRPGRKDDKKPHPRPLVISFNKPSKKYKVLQNAKNLKDQTKWKKVSLCNDKTKMQLHYEQENDKNVEDEIKEKNQNLSNGEKQKGIKWIAKGPKGRKRAQKQQLNLSELFAERTLNGTFSGFDATFSNTNNLSMTISNEETTS